LHRFAPPTSPHGRSNCTGKGWDSRLWAFYHKGIPIAADSGIDSSIRVHARAHIIVSTFKFVSICQRTRWPAAQNKGCWMLNAAKLATLSASLAVSAAKRMYSPSPVPRRQPSRPIPMPMQPSIAFHQNCCTAGTPISQSPCSHLTPHTSPSSESNPHPPLTHTENRTKKHQCVPLCIINVPSNPLNRSAFGRHQPAR
jgi:hypothetical protein